MCTCVWAGERVRGGEMKGPGEEGYWVPLSLAFSLSLPLFLSLSHCRSTLTLEAEEEILAAWPLHYRYVLLIYISWSYGSFNSIPHTAAYLNLCILDDMLKYFQTNELEMVFKISLLQLDVSRVLLCRLHHQAVTWRNSCLYLFLGIINQRWPEGVDIHDICVM